MLKRFFYKHLRHLLKLVLILSFAYISTLSICVARIAFQGTALYESVKKISAQNSSFGQTEFQKSLKNADTIFQETTPSLFLPIRWGVGKFLGNDHLWQWWQEIRPARDALPSIAGFDRPKRYFVAFQNPAEARGSGGIIGAYAVVEISRGKPKFLRFGSNADLQSEKVLPIAMPRDFVTLYRNDPAIWQNSNVSPHFPYGAQLYLALWKKQFNEDLDGVIALDPFLLRSLLETQGPIKVSGITVDSQNIIEWTLSRAYSYFQDNDVRKQFLVDLISQLGQSLQNRPNLDPRILASFIDPMLEHRVLIYSTDTQVQKILEASNISGTLDALQSKEFRLIAINTSGNKLDYYLGRKVTVQRIACSDLTRVEISVTNEVSPLKDLPAYVKGRLDLKRPEGSANSYGVTLLLYGPADSEILNAIDEKSGLKAGQIFAERGRTVLILHIDLAAGETRTVSATFQGGFGHPTIFTQPLVKPQVNRVIDSCTS